MQSMRRLERVMLPAVARILLGRHRTEQFRFVQRIVDGEKADHYGQEDAHLRANGNGQIFGRTVAVLADQINVGVDLIWMNKPNA